MATDAEFIALQEALAGEYSIERELGRGGMGIVYLAREVQLDRLVAIKVLPSTLAAQEGLRERFLREARMAAGLSHPHIVPIHRVGEIGGFVFFVMAYVSGQTLGARLRERGPLSPDAAARMLREVAWALAYAHGRGIVHRDVKPDNILLEAETGRALVSDFGIARAAREGESQISDPGRLMGTAHFMSPEQSTGETLDGRSDLYSLGVVGYLALSGRLPFDAPSSPALLLKHVHEPAPALTGVAAGVPARLADVIDRCLAKRPADRFASGEDLADALTSMSAPRRQVPMPLRLWAQHQDPLRILYFGWSTLFGLGTISEFRPGGDWPITLMFALAPIIPSALFHARKAQRALDAGYSLTDLRATLKDWIAQRREELKFEHPEHPALGGRVLRAVAWTAAAIMAVVAFTPVHPPVLMVGAVNVARIVGFALVLTAMGGAAGANAFGVPLLGRTLRRRLEGSLRSLFWNSKAGEWFARLLAPKHRAIAAESAYRPTEVALSLAVDELFDALPKAYRQHLASLPATVRDLESHAADARRRLDELTSTQLRDKAKQELSEAVTMLEAIRLDLLRLHGGAMDLAPLTTVLERAQRLGDELQALEEGQRKVDAALGFSTPV